MLTKAGDAKEVTEKAEIIERAQIDIIGVQAENNGDITEAQLNEILAKYGRVTGEGEDKVITTDEGYVIKVSDIWSETTSGGGGGATLPSIEGVTTPYLPDSQSEVIENSTLETGLVVKDKNDNEWVWIQVPKTIYTDPNYTVANSNNSVTLSTDYTGIYNILNKYAETYREGKSEQGYYWTDEWYDGSNKTASTSSNLNDTTGCGLTSSEYTTNYQKMLTSIYTNGGFWIGRYEAGIEGTTGAIVEGETAITSLARTKSSSRIDSSSPKAISQKDAIPYNYVYCSEAQRLASAMSPDSSKTSSLMFGIQWDLVCKYLEGKDGLTTANINSNSTDWGNYKDKSLDIDSADAKKYQSSAWSSITGTKSASSILLSTGASNTVKKMNIYDFAGNEWEWTLEHATADSIYPCAYRGGRYRNSGSYGPASYRDGGATAGSGDSSSFRPALY